MYIKTLHVYIRKHKLIKIKHFQKFKAKHVAQS